MRWYGLLAIVAIIVESAAGAEIASKLPGNSDWKSLVLIGVLAVEFLLVAVTTTTIKRKST